MVDFYTFLVKIDPKSSKNSKKIKNTCILEPTFCVESISGTFRVIGARNLNFLGHFWEIYIILHIYTIWLRTKFRDIKGLPDPGELTLQLKLSGNDVLVSTSYWQSFSAFVGRKNRCCIDCFLKKKIKAQISEKWSIFFETFIEKVLEVANALCVLDNILGGNVLTYQDATGMVLDIVLDVCAHILT